MLSSGSADFDELFVVPGEEVAVAIVEEPRPAEKVGQIKSSQTSTKARKKTKKRQSFEDLRLDIG